MLPHGGTDSLASLSPCDGEGSASAVAGAGTTQLAPSSWAVSIVSFCGALVVREGEALVGFTPLGLVSATTDMLGPFMGVATADRITAARLDRKLVEVSTRDGASRAKPGRKGRNPALELRAEISAPLKGGFITSSRRAAISTWDGGRHKSFDLQDAFRAVTLDGLGLAIITAACFSEGSHFLLAYVK